MNRNFKRDRGFLVFAQNGSTDYLRLAYGLALSLKATQKEHGYLSVLITPGMEVPDQYREVFDEVIDIPWIDEAVNSEWKLENEWKAYHATPYRETIKLDADMLFTSDVSVWWDLLSTQDFWVATRAETYRGEEITLDFYRKIFTSADLPNVYTAFMFFRYSDIAQQVFEMAELIFHNWEKFSYEFLGEDRPEQATTDVVFSLAIKLCGLVDECTFPAMAVPSLVHMKSKLQGWPPEAPENWLPALHGTLTPDLKLKIGRHLQTMPVHYHVKGFLTDDMLKTYERAIR